MTVFGWAILVGTAFLCVLVIAWLLLPLLFLRRADRTGWSGTTTPALKTKVLLDNARQVSNVLLVSDQEERQET